MGKIDMTTSELKKRLYFAGLEAFQVSPSTFSALTQADGWQSPEAPEVEVDPILQDNFSYNGTSVVYDGTDDIRIRMACNVTVSCDTNNTEIDFTVGKNGTPNENKLQSGKTRNANDEQNIACSDVFTISNGDSLDFFVRQTNQASVNLTIEHGEYHIRKID